MADEKYPLHHSSQVDIASDAPTLFALLDDHRRLAAHMSKPSAMMLWASMQLETDARRGQAVCSVIRMTGRVLGIRLAVEELVTEREAPRRKTWETIGEPRLVVIGAYRMGSDISPVMSGSRLVVFIDYRLPPRGLTRGLGRLLKRAYAAWCTRRMAADAAAALGPTEPR